jgi:hypothetical protein
MTALRREVRFEPGYDHRAEDASKPAGKRRGCHGLNIRFLLHGAMGCVQFCMYTDWLPSHVDHGAQFGPRVDRKLDHYGLRNLDLFPMAADLGHHWRAPLYEGEWQPTECEFLGHPCYYDGSGLNAEPVMAALFIEGDAGVWRHLEEYYEYCRVKSEQHASAS